ncbi:MAG: hypothetical protein WB767_14910 [Nocardioides sp.]
MPGPPPRVLDLFVVPDVVEPIPGVRGGSVRAGDLVLSPGRDAGTATWLNPVLARLAVRLDEQAAGRRGLRVAMPIPARDGSWVVEGWGASRYEPETAACHDLDVMVAAGRLLHAQLAVAVPERPRELCERIDGWGRAERLAFADAATLATVAADQPGSSLVRRAAALLDDVDLGPDQLVHVDLAGKVLLDALGAPVILDVVPAWRPVLWAEAICVLDSVAWFGAPVSALGRWTSGADRQAMLRALIFRVVHQPDTATGYESVLSVLARTAAT